MSRETVLAVDDEEDILELLRYNLEAEGYRVICAGSGEEALKSARTEPVDLILLDIMLPGIGGLEVAGLLKKNPETRHIPVVMLTARGDEADIVAGLEQGADDYITKPFSPKVLAARIKTVIRRQSRDMPDNETAIRFDDLVIHPGQRAVWVRETPADLTFTEFQVLYFLAVHPGWVFTRFQIVDAVRGDNYPVTDRSVDVQIAGLRKKLGHCGKYIETVRGVGYRFKA